MMSRRQTINNRKIGTIATIVAEILVALFLISVIIAISSTTVDQQNENSNPLSTNNAGISKYTDTEAGVLCYLYNTNRSDSISCVPLSQTRLK